MNLHHTTIRDLSGNPSLEALEMSDVGGRTGLPDDVQAEMDAAFGYGTERDEMTEREIDLAYEAEMERRERESRVTFCGAPDDGDDDHTPRPAAGAALPPGTIIRDAFASYSDEDLILAVTLIDGGKVENISEEQRHELLDAATAEVLRRLNGRLRRAA